MRDTSLRYRATKQELPQCDRPQPTRDHATSSEGRDCSHASSTTTIPILEGLLVPVILTSSRVCQPRKHVASAAEIFNMVVNHTRTHSQHHLCRFLSQACGRLSSNDKRRLHHCHEHD